MNSNIYSCPTPGHNNKIGSISSDDCVACPSGLYANIGGSACYPWPTNRYVASETSTDWSGVCGPGRYMSNEHDCKYFYINLIFINHNYHFFTFI